MVEVLLFSVVLICKQSSSGVSQCSVLGAKCLCVGVRISSSERCGERGCVDLKQQGNTIAGRGACPVSRLYFSLAHQ